MISVFFARHFRFFVAGLIVLVLSSTLAFPSYAEPDKRGASGLPLPRFVSIKGNPVNLRQGPGTQYPALLTFKRVGWPVEILDENSNWRKIRDYDDDIGWIQANLLRGKRSVVLHQNRDFCISTRTLSFPSVPPARGMHFGMWLSFPGRPGDRRGMHGGLSL